MCGVIGIFSEKECFDRIISGMKVLQNRGRDSVGASDGKTVFTSKTIRNLKKLKSKNIVGHLLHSIVSHVPQPIKKKGILVFNGEIYNWIELREKYGFDSKNDSELLIDLIEKIGVKDALPELDGVYAFCYWKGKKVIIARDIIGVKPLWYSIEEGFSFASEKKALIEMGFKDIVELNPRTIIEYNLKQKSFKKTKREFFKIFKNKESKENILLKTESLLIDAIKKRIPEKKFGILFSGGIDSTFLAYVCKKLGKDFTCYTAALSEKGMEEAKDLVYAKKVAKKLGLKLKVKKLNLKESEEYLKIVPQLIEDNNVVKVGVGLTFFAACYLAAKDGNKVILSGLGSEEIFAGYERHKKSLHINKECLSGLLKMYERDLYRDDVITMFHKLELRLPFLDKKLVDYSLSIPPKLKINEKQNKIVLREIAKKMGLPKEFAERKKIAAQYGSKFDRAILKLSKKEGFSRKSDYLYQFYHPPNVKLGVLWSTGKDSAFAAYTMLKQNYEISCLISMISENKDSYMFHTPTINLAKFHSEAMNIPIVEQKTKGKKDDELKDLKKAILLAKKKYKIEGIVTGAIHSNYQRERIEKICDSLELKIFSPLWHIDPEKYMNDLLKNGFKVIITKIAADGLDKGFLGREIDKRMITDLKKIHARNKIHLAFEGGEAETLVLDCPMFNKKIDIVKSTKFLENKYTGTLNIEKIKLNKKF